MFKPNQVKERVLAGNGQHIVLKSEHSKEDAQAGKGASVGVGKGGRGVEDLRTKWVLCFYGVTAPRPCLSTREYICSHIHVYIHTYIHKNTYIIICMKCS